MQNYPTDDDDSDSEYGDESEEEEQCKSNVACCPAV